MNAVELYNDLFFFRYFIIDARFFRMVFMGGIPYFGW